MVNNGHGRVCQVGAHLGQTEDPWFTVSSTDWGSGSTGLIKVSRFPPEIPRGQDIPLTMYHLLTVAPLLAVQVKLLSPSSVSLHLGLRPQPHPTRALQPAWHPRTYRLRLSFSSAFRFLASRL